jgi:hypothetical protein
MVCEVGFWVKEERPLGQKLKTQKKEAVKASKVLGTVTLVCSYNKVKIELIA